MFKKMLGLRCRCKKRLWIAGRNTNEIKQKLHASGWQEYPMTADGTNGYCPDPNCQSDKALLDE